MHKPLKAISLKYSKFAQIMMITTGISNIFAYWTSVRCYATLHHSLFVLLKKTRATSDV